MFTKKDNSGYKIPLEGIEQKTLVYGEKTLPCEFNHTHPHEQTGYLVSGRLNLLVGEARFQAGPGDSWCIEGDVEHGAGVLEVAVAVEVFSPVRVDYLP